MVQNKQTPATQASFLLERENNAGKDYLGTAPQHTVREAFWNIVFSGLESPEAFGQIGKQEGAPFEGMIAQENSTMATIYGVSTEGTDLYSVACFASSIYICTWLWLSWAKARYLNSMVTKSLNSLSYPLYGTESHDMTCNTEQSNKLSWAKARTKWGSRWHGYCHYTGIIEKAHCKWTF